ncbi:UDP-N-acetylglucosamine--N-acetylmuramyl-(pentapeptide) pyrophosphoryl-undecaprenol N-acetylglucosamine transferase [hydrothermal vent metagenome]|uniref:UDP-N-acetylglucosamine--N-acetylmuramyl-(Pentapeptide) pyrophosphoryl-undecaprenol N-acetylglucosamine transferase n=1 Tax=hydrothermal vent metagenome TaxID=652676 RepID=A0A3B0SAE9_9ZZZZ
MKIPAIIAIAAGGTGGHVFPAAALSGELQSRGIKTVLVTDQRGDPLTTDFPCDDKLVLQTCSPNPRRPVRFIADLFGIFKATLRAGSYLKQHGCSRVVGFGGYPSLPTLLAAKWLGLPIILHEQNAVLGRSNRLFAGSANWIASGFDNLERLPDKAKSRHVVTGNPLRPDILAHSKTPFPATDGKLHLLVLGGSLGARILSETVPAAMDLLPVELSKRLQVTAQITQDRLETAQAGFERAGVTAELAPFFDDIAGRLAKAHLVVARAGASTIAELAAIGRAAILVPLAIAMDDHQSGNANVLKQAGAADVISEEALTPEKLAAVLSVRLLDGDELAKRAKLAKTVARNNAAVMLADLVMEKGSK